jgi:hypothetical protein
MPIWLPIWLSSRAGADWVSVSPTASSRRSKSQGRSAPMHPIRKVSARVSLPGYSRKPRAASAS